jgi:para-nitrobenzyl esterase
VSAWRAAAIASEYPPGAHPDAAVSTLVSDASFACPALQVDQWTAQRVPTFDYEFNDDNAPQPFTPAGFITVATHESELPYLFDLPNAPFHGTFRPGQQTLAASMRAAWVNFAATGNPGVHGRAPGPPSTTTRRCFRSCRPRHNLRPTFAARQHCAFWATG